MLSEINQTEKDKYSMFSFKCRILHSEIASRMVTTSARVWGEWGDVSQRVQSSSYKRKKFWESNV